MLTPPTQPTFATTQAQASTSAKRSQVASAATQPPVAAGPSVTPDFFVAIDLGTTFSTVTIIKAGKKIHPSFTGSGQSMPTAVLVQDDGTVLFGRQAMNASARHPEKLAAHFKRGMTTDPNGKNYDGRSPVELSILVLQHLWSSARKCEPEIEQYIAELGGSRDPALLSISVTCPATYNLETQRILKEDVGGQVGEGFRIDSVITESVAAGYDVRETISAKIHNGDRILIADLGGGTFDVSVLELIDGKCHQIVGGTGDESLGGMNATAAILEAFCEAANVNWLDALDPIRGLCLAKSTVPESEWRFCSKAYDCCEEAKKDLTVNAKTVQFIDTPAGNVEFELSRDVFIQRLEDAGFYDRFRKAVRECIDGTGLSLQDIEYIASVGGSALLPGLAAILAEETERQESDVVIAGDPTHTISDGAALSARFREDAALCLAGGLGFRTFDPADPSRTYPKFAFGTGESLAPNAPPVEQFGQLVRSNGKGTIIDLRLVEAKSGVRVPRPNGAPVIVPEDQCVEVNRIMIPIEALPPGEHPVKISFFFDVCKELNVKLDFPTVPDCDCYTARVGDPSTVAAVGIDMTLALDCSGSMSGNNIKQLKKSVRWLLDENRNRDVRTGVVEFGMQTQLVSPMGTHIDQIKKGIEALATSGGTPMDAALRISTDHFNETMDASRERLCVLVTDGQTNEASAMAAADDLKPIARLVTIGIGSAVSEEFLRGLATSPSDYKWAKTPEDLMFIFEQLSKLLLDTREYKV